MNEQTGYLLLGALIAVTVVLLIGAMIGGVVVLRGLGYFGRFKGLQLSRNGKGDMSFGGVIDETPPEPALAGTPLEAPAELPSEAQTMQ